MSPDFDGARLKIKQLQEVVDSYAPAPNKVQLIKVTSICNSFDVRDSYINNKIGNLQSRFESYFSVQKWSSCPGGAAGLKVEIVGLIKRISDQVEAIASAKSP